MRQLAALALALGLAGCSTYDPLVALGIRSENPNKPTPLAPITEKVAMRLAWSTNVGKAGGFPLRPQAEGGRVYAASSEGQVLVLEEDTGKVLARAETKKKFSGGVGAGDAKLLLGTAKGEVIAMDQTGKVLWTTSVAGEVLSSPALAKKTVVARTADGRIFGFNADDGKRTWVFQRPSPTLLLRSEAGVLVSGGDIVAGYANGKLIALDADDGKLTWEVTVSAPRGTTDLERIADVAGLPLLDGNNICAGAFQGKVACFEVSSRNMLWSRDFSVARTLARDAKNVIVVDVSDAVHALDRASGASAWKQDKLLYRRLTAPLVHESLIIVGDGQGYLHAISQDDGSLIGRLATDGSAVIAVAPVSGGVLFQTEKGMVGLVRL